MTAIDLLGCAGIGSFDMFPTAEQRLMTAFAAIPIPVWKRSFSKAPLPA
jgi:hypothetical protein